MKTSLALIAAALGLAGCADTMLSDNRIRGETAIALGVQPEAVLIADRRYDGLTNTYYTAKTGRARYSCAINGGGALAMGMTNPPACQRL